MNYSETYVNDLNVIKPEIKNIDRLYGTSILVTGARGLICSAVIDFLLSLNRQIDVFAAGRNVDKMKSRFCAHTNNKWLHFIKYDASEPFVSEQKFDFIIDGASNASPKNISEFPVETMLANFIGLHNLLDYSRTHATKRVLYISSSEVYGKKNDTKPYNTNDYGFVDILNPRASYPSSKRAAETLCSSYLKEYGIDTVIVRPGHVYGPTMSDDDNRASSQFPREVIAGHDIVMKSPGSQIRSYCYVADCVSAIVTVLLNGCKDEAYNISNCNSIVTIRQMAECFASAGNRKIIFDIPSEAEKASYNLMDNSSLNAEKLEALGWKGLFDMPTGALHTLNIMCNK